MKTISASLILMPDGLRDDLSIRVNEEGQVTEICGKEEATENHEGILSPGFINAHCHLELSHMKGMIPRETGIADFALDIVKKRNETSEAEQVSAMKNADEEMLANGIVAVGDICNGPVSFDVKENGGLRYHSFIELIGFDAGRAADVFAKGKELLESSRNSASFAAHAPYSVSGDLVALIREYEEQHSGLMTIHNQESLAEEEFFFYAKGDLISLYEKLGVDLGDYKAQRQSSLRSILPWFGRKGKLLLVHNTFTKTDEIGWAELVNRNIWWCFCPNANLYIEKKLPDIFSFYDEGVKIVLGTDSLASNDQLSILEEVKQVQKWFPQIPLADVLQWATRNAANYFGYDDLGEFSIGKKPGLVLIEGAELGKAALGGDASSRRIA